MYPSDAEIAEIARQGRLRISAGVRHCITPFVLALSDQTARNVTSFVSFGTPFGTVVEPPGWPRLS